MARKQKKDLGTVRIDKGDRPQRHELVPLEEIGIPKMDNDPRLSCFLYNGHETKEVLNGSIVVVNQSEIDHIEGELYVFKYFPYPEIPTTFFYILRRFCIPSTLGGFELRSTGEKEIMNVPSMDLLHKMMVGRVWYMYIDRRLYLDRLQDHLRVDSGELYFHTAPNEG